jgi:four helix bundle protein
MSDAPLSCMDPEQLRARARRFAVEVSRFCETLPRDHRSQEIANQLHDAALSVAANYRAVCRAQTPKLFFSKLCVVVEEIDEVQGWLETLIDSGKCRDERIRGLHQEATELVKIFTASKRTWLRNHQRP